MRPDVHVEPLPLPLQKPIQQPVLSCLRITVPYTPPHRRQQTPAGMKHAVGQGRKQSMRMDLVAKLAEQHHAALNLSACRQGVNHPPLDPPPL